jgi:hypothetical protein
MGHAASLNRLWESPPSGCTLDEALASVADGEKYVDPEFFPDEAHIRYDQVICELGCGGGGKAFQEDA